MESCLGANLNTWLAGDMHDCQKLQALIHGIQGRRCSVLGSSVLINS